MSLSTIDHEIHEMQKLLGIDPAGIILEHQPPRFCKHMWIILLGYVQGICLRHICSASRTLHDMGEMLYPDALRCVFTFRRNYGMAFPIIKRNFQIRTDPYYNIRVARPMHGCRHAIRCCARTVNGWHCRNLTTWDGCYGPLCTPHCDSQGIVQDGGVYKDLQFENHSWHPINERL